MSDPLLEAALTLVVCWGWLHMLFEHWNVKVLEPSSLIVEETKKSGDSTGREETGEPPQGKGGGWAV